MEFMGSMASQEPRLNLQNCHYQAQSPLFGVLPGEIRNKIFANSLVQYEDDSAAYPEDSYWYRPGFKAPKKSSSSLLQTCKLAYIEGQRIFLEELEWAFWFDRGPAGRSGSRACEQFFNKLAPSQVHSLEQVRFFTQMYWLEGGRAINRLFANANFRPSKLTITIRYSDWWNWEGNARLSMRQDWLANFKGPPGLRELRVEYETISWKKKEMLAIVTRNKDWRLAVRDGGHLSAENTHLEEWCWTGPSRLGGRTWAHHGEGESVDYVVVTDTWKYSDGPVPEDILHKQAEFQNDESDEDDAWSEAESDDEGSEQDEEEDEE
ncbi:hypothetical protein N0V93_000317 [Gnomoniopsis smithogilvyi]|uniref:Uncharacterized protein n=1 Tax=Gnomoniopsis smithogilvyi TaxID=1191159 RepID=A0A9W8Z215_9PEZI|nr:hypothetical protein N0V93_000317 [Gnomoniopsis smithogilvyi]